MSDRFQWRERAIAAEAALAESRAEVERLTVERDKIQPSEPGLDYSVDAPSGLDTPEAEAFRARGYVRINRHSPPAPITRAEEAQPRKMWPHRTCACCKDLTIQTEPPEAKPAV